MDEGEFINEPLVFAFAVAYSVPLVLEPNGKMVIRPRL